MRCWWIWGIMNGRCEKYSKLTGLQIKLEENQEVQICEETDPNLSSSEPDQISRERTPAEVTSPGDLMSKSQRQPEERTVYDLDKVLQRRKRYFYKNESLQFKFL